MRSGSPRAARREGGFTYLGLVILVTVIGLVGAATLKVDSLLRRAAAEEELLEIGAAFGAALRTYAEATPKGQPAQPPSLQELLKDSRSPAVRRHLRKIFVDPLTGKAEWGIVWADIGGHKSVLAVYSLSQARPLKVANFDARFSTFEKKEHIADWKFTATGLGILHPEAGTSVERISVSGAPQSLSAKGKVPLPDADMVVRNGDEVNPKGAEPDVDSINDDRPLKTPTTLSERVSPYDTASPTPTYP